MMALTIEETDGLRDRVMAAIPDGVCSLLHTTRSLSSLLHHAVQSGALPSFREVNLALDQNDCLGCDGQQGDRVRISECARNRIVTQFGPALPTAEAFHEFESNGWFLEVGATTGFWSAILARRGANVLACTEPRMHRAPMMNQHIPIVGVDAHIMTQAFPDRTILMVWPEQTDWPLRVLESMQSGQRIVAITEGRYGHCATEDFFDCLRSDFWCDSDLSLPHWIGAQDYVHIHVKK